mgnify:CR=1 FL=1
MVSIEGVPCHASTDIVYRLQRKLAGVPGIALETPCARMASPAVDSSCAYARIFSFFEALQACSPHCRVMLMDRSFYSCDSHSLQVMETARALNEALLPPVTLHLMFVLQPDANDAFSDFLASNTWPGVSLKDVYEYQAARLKTAKCPTGHPWNCVSFTIPLPPFCGDNPAILDDIANDLVAIVLHRLA